MVRIKPPLVESYWVLVNKLEVVLLKGGLSVSSLSVFIVIESITSTRDTVILAAVSLNLPPSSWNLTRYVPANAGTKASVALPGTAWITSWAAWNVADPPVKFECLI